VAAGEGMEVMENEVVRRVAVSSIFWLGLFAFDLADCQSFYGWFGSVVSWAASFLRSQTTSLIATLMQPPSHRMIGKNRIHLAQSVLTNMNIPVAAAPPMTTAQTTFNTAPRRTV
jgi:hypothetical protein